MSKRMSAQARQEMIISLQEKYRLGNWKQKNQLLDGFVAATGYERKYAIKLLNGKAATSSNQKKKRGKPPRYDEPVIRVLEMLWHAGNQICSKRLVPFLPELLASMEAHGHVQLTEDIRQRVLSVSAATFCKPPKFKTA